MPKERQGWDASTGDLTPGPRCTAQGLRQLLRRAPLNSSCERPSRRRRAVCSRGDQIRQKQRSGTQAPGTTHKSLPAGPGVGLRPERVHWGSSASGRHSPSLVKVHKKHHVVPEAGQPVGGGHGDDEGEHVVNEGVEGLRAGGRGCGTGPQRPPGPPRHTVTSLHSRRPLTSEPPHEAAASWGGGAREGLTPRVPPCTDSKAQRPTCSPHAGPRSTTWEPGYHGASLPENGQPVLKAEACSNHCPTPKPLALVHSQQHRRAVWSPPVCVGQAMMHQDSPRPARPWETGRAVWVDTDPAPQTLATGSRASACSLIRVGKKQHGSNSENPLCRCDRSLAFQSRCRAPYVLKEPPTLFHRGAS